MTRREQNQLLNELLSGEELAPLRRASLEQGLAAVRQQRHRRKVGRAVALVCFWMAFVASIIFRPSATRFVTNSSSPPSRQAAVKVQSGPAPQMKFISDEELFSLFPDRAMALIGKPGEQQLVFLDRPSSSFHQ